MAQAVVQNVLYDIAKTSLGVVIVDAVDLQSKVNVLGTSLIARNATNGFMYFLISDSVNYLSGKGSKLLQGDMKAVVDDTIFMGALSGVAEVSGADEKLMKLLGSTVIKDQKLLNIAVESSIISGGRILAHYIDATPEVPQFLKSVRHPSNLLDGTAYTM
jgi:hypothetical protein